MSKLYDEGPCECAMCKDPEGFRKKEKEMIKRLGYAGHYVFNPELPAKYDGITNYHTHYLPDTLQHPDLQLIAPFSSEILGGILENVVVKIREGAKFKEGDEIEGIIQPGYKIGFKNAKECGRDVLRIILPDKDGCLTKDAAVPYDAQHVLEDIG